MKKYLIELIILFIQLFMFYIFPLFAGPTDAMGMVFLIWLSTIILGILITLISINKIKYLYPVVIAILFIPLVSKKSLIKTQITPQFILLSSQNNLKKISKFPTFI